MTEATVLVVDDEPAVRNALSRLLRATGLAVITFATAAEFLDSPQVLQPGCLILDVDLPGMTGVELQHRLIAAGSDLAIVFLTGRGDIGMGVDAMKAGAVDFLTKPVDDTVLLRAVEQALARSLAARAARCAQQDMLRLLTTLTPREREVLPLIVAGRLNKQIAAELGTVEKTIKVHRARLMSKLQVRTVADLVRFAARAGIDVPLA